MFMKYKQGKVDFCVLMDPVKARGEGFLAMQCHSEKKKRPPHGTIIDTYQNSNNSLLAVLFLSVDSFIQCLYTKVADLREWVE